MKREDTKSTPAGEATAAVEILALGGKISFAKSQIMSIYGLNQSYTSSPEEKQFFFLIYSQLSVLKTNLVPVYI